MSSMSHYQQKLTYSIQNLQPKMKYSAPDPSQRLLLHSICSKFAFSIQTKHAAIQLLMNPQIAQSVQYTSNIVITAIFIAQKIHELFPISVSQLTPSQYGHILETEMHIYQITKFKICGVLLIDQVTQVAYLWDKFISNLTCMTISFFDPYSHYTDSLLLQITEKLIYKPKCYNFEFRKLGMAIIWVILKNAERRKNKGRMFQLEKSTNFIFSQFLLENWEAKLEQFEQELMFVEANVWSLFDIRSSNENIENCMLNQQEKDKKCLKMEKRKSKMH